MHIKIGAADFWTCSKWIHQTVFLFTENYLQYRGHSSNVVHWWNAAKKQLPFTNSSSEKQSCLRQQSKHYLLGRTVHFLFYRQK